MGLAAQWEHISASLPADWESTALRLAIEDDNERRRASAALGPLTPGRVGGELHFVVSRRTGVGPEAARRLFGRLDEARIAGTLTLADKTVAPTVAATVLPRLTSMWDNALEALPDDWSDLLCRVELSSSDDVPQAALLAAPLNPSRPRKERGFDFRVARKFGYGASPQMARRCLVRLDEAGIPGQVEILRALSDTHPVATQGPVWQIEGKML